MKKKNLPSFQPSPREATLEVNENLDQVPSTELNEETMDIVYNPKTKTYDRVYMKYSLDGGMQIVKIQQGHTNPLVMQQEISKYFLEKLVTKRKK